MTTTFIVALVAVGLLVVASAAVCLILFGTLKNEIRCLERQLAGQRELWAELQQAGAAEQQRINLVLQAVQEQGAQAPRSVAPSPGITLTQRSRILRQLRAGESPEQVAKNLQLPKNEVRLLLKVQRILAAAPGKQA